MIKAQDIYAASHDGLDIILYYYPQAEGCVAEPKKKFKRRMDEDDASACLKKYGDCYKVTDFGDQGTAMSPIDVCMYEENVNFQEAIALLAGRYNVTDELKRTVNKPEIRKRPATAEEKEGDRFFELEKGFTQEQLRVLGPRVEKEHVEALHWHVVKSISYVKNREVTTKLSTPTYPIFIRECIIEDSSDPKGVKKFFKIYEPLNPDKQWRFSYTPEGVKPKQYINGLYELRLAYAKYNADEEAKFKNLPENQNKPYRMQKLKEAFICSGERDSLCVRALGYHPLWFNSETYKVSEEEMHEVKKYVETIYNIPDIDSTGVAKGRELALRFLDIHTVWLPKELSRYKDQRGKPRKDFRDFVELHPKGKDFRNLLALAMPAQFWVESYNERSKKRGFDIDTECLHYFLTLNGFYTLFDENSDDVRFIRIQGNIVEEVDTTDISNFLCLFVRERFLQREIRNLVKNSQRLGAASLEKLDRVKLDFTNCTKDGQYMFFPKETWRITGEGITSFPSKTGDGSRYVWNTNVLQHKVSVLPPMFECKITEDAEGTLHYDIDVKDHESNMFRYIINTSRVHWRKELEYDFEDESVEVAEAYRKAHKFDIAGPNLTAAEIQEQKQNLISKLFAIGYNMHRYKSPSQAWAIYAMDNRIGDDGQCNGRSGKSFLFKTFGRFMRTVELSGRNPKLMDNPHVYDRVNQHTDFILVDDCDKYLQTSLFYDSITGGMTVNPKNNRSFFIEFENSPKFGFTTNYVPSEFDPSTSARLLYMVFSDYYHERTPENDYLETRGIRDDFNKNLFTDYTEEEWNQDINFFAQCLAFYLKMSGQGIKIQPPLENIMKRKYKSDMGANFEDWAYQYFSEEGEHLDTLLVRSVVMEDFRRFANLPKCTMQRFTKALKGFAALCPYVDMINPPEMLNTSGRLMRKVDGETQEMIFVRTVKMREYMQKSQLDKENGHASQGELAFVPIILQDDEKF